MSRWARLCFDMLRYRVAAMLWMFMLIGAAWQPGATDANHRYMWAALVLAASYVAATTINDVADKDIDAVNHPGDIGRPLVTGRAGVRDLMAIHGWCWAAAVAVSIPLGAPGVVIALASLIIGRVYSVGQVRLSYRTWLAPLALGIAYVVVPFALGVVVVGATLDAGDAGLVGAVYCLFIARINLKDFRDRRGDALHGKPTLLLRFGKRATCLVSLVFLLAGDLLLILSLGGSSGVAALLQVPVILILYSLRWLYREREPHLEQVAIGAGAKAGNGLLLAFLGDLVLADHGATGADRLLFVGMVVAAFCLAVVAIASRPEDVAIAYKG